VEPGPTTQEQIDRRALRAVAVQFFTNGATIATIVPRLPDLRDRVDISIGTLGVVLTIGSLASLIGSLFAGRVVARLGSRRVLVYGAVFSIGFLPVVGIATSPVVLAIGLFGVLFFDIFIDVAMNLQGSAISARRHTPVMNRLHGLWSLGSVAGGLVTVAALRADVGVAVQFTAVAVVLIVALRFVAAGLLRTADTPPPAEEGWTADHVAAARDAGLVVATGSTEATDPTDDERTSSEDDRSAAGDRSAESGAPIRRWSFAALVLGVGGATAMSIEMTNSDWAAFRLGDDLGATPGVAGLGFVIFGAAMTVGRLSGDWVQVRVGAGTLIRGAAGLALVGALLATLVPNVPVSIAGFLVGGLGTAVLFPQLYDRAARWPGPTGSGFAAMLVGQRGSAVVTPALVGVLADTDALSVGQAMAIVLVPSATLVLATTFVSPASAAR